MLERAQTGERGAGVERVPEKVAVPFTGPPADDAPLSWGQWAVWQDMQAMGHSLSLSDYHKLPAGSTVEDLVAGFARLISRYPALRMRLDRDPQGSPRQAVHTAGNIDVDVVTLPDSATPQDAKQHALTVQHQQQTAPFDPYRDWPAQLTLIRHRDALAYQVFTISHLAADGTALLLLRDELTSAVRTDEPRAMNVLDLARRESTGPLRRVSDRAMRHWQSQLGSAPPMTFGEPRHPDGRDGHRYWHGVFYSAAAQRAMLAIAQRTGNDISCVLYAVVATAIGRATGVTPLTTNIVVSNRFRPGYAEIIAPLSQRSVITIDVADRTVDDVIEGVRRAMLTAAISGYYDPLQLEEVVADAAGRLGYQPVIGCMINDTRTVLLDPYVDAGPPAAVTRQQVIDKLPKTFLEWNGTLPGFIGQAWLTVFGNPRALLVQAIFDMACLSEEQAESLLRGIEEVAVAAAFDEAAPTQVSRAR